MDKLEEQAAMDRVLERIKAGNEERISWEQFQAIDDPEEQSDILALLAAKDAVARGEEELLDWEEVKAELGLDGR